MNTVWSEHIQGIKTLYLSRKIRFDGRFKEQYMKLFALDPEKKLKILEIGCGQRHFPRHGLFGAVRVPFRVRSAFRDPRTLGPGNRKKIKIPLHISV